MSNEITASEILVKQPAESRIYSIDFSALLGTTETISTMAVTSMLIGGDTSDLTIGTPTEEDGVVSFRISGGTHNYRYRIEVTVTTNASNTIEGDCILKVSDR